jgi:MFS family permease
MALSPTPLMFALTAGVLIGAAQAGTTYAVIYGVIGRQIPAEKRSWAMGVAAAAGSFGQFLMVPVEGQLIARLGWHSALLVLAAMVLIIVPLAFGAEPARPTSGAQPDHLAGHARGLQIPSFVLLTAGWLVAAVVFIGVRTRPARQRPVAEVTSYAWR